MVILSKFTDRMKEFMILNNVNATQLAEKTGINRSTISGLLREEHIPSTKALLAFVEYFHCSADYLLGITDDYPENSVFLTPVTTFGERFRLLLKETNISQYELTKNDKISGNLLYRWLNNQTYPSVFYLIKLSDIMGVSIDYLLGRKQ